MAIRDVMRDSATPFLQPGETVQAVFGTQTANQNLAALAGAFVFLGLHRYRIAAATDRRILVLDAGKVSMKKARGLLAALPRSTRLGPTEGIWHVIDVNGEKLRVHRRFFRDIERADATAAASAA